MLYVYTVYLDVWINHTCQSKFWNSSIKWSQSIGVTQLQWLQHNPLGHPQLSVTSNSLGALCEGRWIFLGTQCLFKFSFFLDLHDVFHQSEEKVFRKRCTFIYLFTSTIIKVYCAVALSGFELNAHILLKCVSMLTFATEL